MTRSEYLNIVSNKIERLPKDEYDKAMARFNKYFDDAGAENEQAVINDLGDPAAAGDRVIRNLAIDNSEGMDAGKSIKSNINALWIGILAVLACPIALPLAIALLAVVFALVLAIGSIILALGITGIAMVIACPVVLLAASIVMIKSLPICLTCVGIAFILFGLGGVIIYGTYLLFKWMLKELVSIFGKIAHKEEKKYES